MILLIDTAQETATAALAEGGRILYSEENTNAKDAASWLHPAIGRLMEKTGKTVRDLEAVAVVAGPGSYTGLRVGMAAAKGLCYALKIPLITRNTLQVMAESMRAFAAEKGALICPMIDARRNEVFTALYHPTTANDQRPTANSQRPTADEFNELQELIPPRALILDKNSFETVLSGNPILFFGSGAEKWKKITEAPSAIFEPQPNSLQAFADLATLDFTEENWSDPVYTEPVYLKEFFSY